MFPILNATSLTIADLPSRLPPFLSRLTPANARRDRPFRRRDEDGLDESAHRALARPG
jgi:hypothetical protein